MGAFKIMHRGFAEFFQLIHQLTSYALLYVSAFVARRAKTAARVVALSSQLAGYVHRVQQAKQPRSRFTPMFRVL